MAPLIAPESQRSHGFEPAVDRARREPVAPQPELEHRDVPADRADGELTLAEEWAAAGAERTPGRATNAAGPTDPILALERDEGRTRQRPPDAVDRTGGKSVRS